MTRESRERRPEAGYASREYAASFEEVGAVVTLSRSGLHLISRPLPGGRFDLVGLYPYSTCCRWDHVAEEVDGLRANGAVSVVLVSDPFATLPGQPPDVGWSLCREFKTHWIVDLEQDWRARRTKNTRYYTRRALRNQDIEISEGGPAAAREFWLMYRHTIARHRIDGLQRFSTSAIERQVAVPGGVILIARRGSTVYGALIAYQDRERGVLHLMGVSPAGRALHTSYALIHTLLETLENHGCRQMNLGGGAGYRDASDDDLVWFKRRWASERRTTLLLGQILDPEAYRALADSYDGGESQFFPSYRRPGSPLEWRPWPEPANT